MRKTFGIVLTLALTLTLIFGLSSCGECKHEDLQSNVTAPTCTERGYATYSCTECGHSYIDNYVDALGHTPAEAVAENLVDSTCTQVGSYDAVVYCTTCGEKISTEAKTVEKKPHDYNQKATTSIFVKTEATCNDSAVYYYSCICGERGNTTFSYGEANGHSYASAWEKDAIHHWHKANCEHTSEISEKNEHEYGTDNICDICEYVSGIAVSKITLNYTSFAAMVGDVKTLTATVTPDDATNKNVMWTTSNSAVITVDNNGVVTAVGAGNAVVYVVSEDGAAMAQCVVVVIGNECLHTTTRTERENVVDSTCKETGSYNEVIYCSACGYELGRTEKEIPKKETHTPVTDARVEPTFTETGLTEGSHCGICGIVIVAQEIIPTKPSKSVLVAEKLTVNGTNISGSFSYATNEFNFANDISVTNNGTWVLSTDVNGVHTIIKKTSPLNEGNNVFYIHVENPDKTVTTYTVNIYRNHMYTVLFNTDGGTSVEPQYVEEGYLATTPSTNKIGYTFASWNYDFNTPITANITIKANWNANTGTAYKVEYYLENVDKTAYDIIVVETENLTGTTDTTANAEQKTFTHFTLNTSKSTLSGNINGNGNLILKVYYTRNTYTVSTSRNNTKGGTVTSGGTYAYDKSITLTATTSAGYTFLGWFEGETKVCDSLTYTFKVDHSATYTAKWSANTNTTYKVEYYFENVDKNGYDIVSAETENLAGTTDTTANAEQKTFDHFTLNTSKSTLSGNINGNGSLVLKVYYTRNAYSVNSDDTSIGTVNNGGSYGYNKQITVSASVSKLGYTFIGWYSGEDLLSSDSEYTFNIDKNVVAKFDVAEEMKNFNFTSTATTCSITGIKDKTLTEIIVPDYVTYISSAAFSGCSSLEIISIPFVGNTIGKTNNQYEKFGVIFGTSPYEGSYAVRQDRNASSYYAKIYYIPKSLKFVTITGGEHTLLDAFYNCSSLTNISIGDEIKSIKKRTFENCYNLKSIELSESITSIDEYAFANCYNLTEITMSSNLECIGEGAFSGCVNLTNITLPRGLTNIGDYAFSGCYRLIEVTNNSSLNIIEGNSDYGGVAKYALEIHQGTVKGAVNADNYLFYTVNDTNYLIGYIGQDSILTLPEDYNGENYVINKFAFKSSNITSVIISNGVTNIGEEAFRESSLVSVTIPNSTVSIGEDAFVWCFKLVEVVNNSSLDVVTGTMENGWIAYYAKEVHSGASKIVYRDNYIFYSHDGSNYLLGYIGNEEKLSLPENYNGQNYEIYNYAFDNYYFKQNNFTEIIIPNSVTRIGESAFHFCANLKNVTISDNVTEIGSYAFSGCYALEKFELPVGIIRIGLDAFPRNCMTNENGAYYVGDWVVGFNHNTSTVAIMDGTVGIADGAFQFATSLVSVYIPNSIKFIGSEAFLGCNNLIGATFENSYDDWNCLWSGSLGIERVVSCYDLQNTQTAAEYLKSTYCYYCWCKIEQ